jgi:hypothetical protein
MTLAANFLSSTSGVADTGGKFATFTCQGALPVSTTPVVLYCKVYLGSMFTAVLIG